MSDLKTMNHFSMNEPAIFIVRMIDQGSGEINIIVGVEDQNFEKTVCPIYEGFVG
jgi:hypothetical protein